ADKNVTHRFAPACRLTFAIQGEWLAVVLLVSACLSCRSFPRDPTFSHPNGGGASSAASGWCSA
ncbi:MAG: hypothetical protein ACXW3U_13045, partial [Rhodoplanes sp.]